MVSKPVDLWGLIPAEVDPMVTVDRLRAEGKKKSIKGRNHGGVG